MILVRLILIFLIVYLLVRGFIRSLYPEDPLSRDGNNQQKFNNTGKPPKKVSKSIGEYVDYEESKNKESGGS